MPRDIQVLMTTYNGAAFVEAQLDSLRRQTVAGRIRLLVRDDGSTDDTLARLRGYKAGALAIDIVTGPNLGVRASFLELMRAADDNCHFFLLCDQDDVWDDDKVAVAVAALEPFAQADTPVLYCGRSLVTQADLTPIGPTDDAPAPSFANALVQNIAPGHTMAMNRALLHLACQTMQPDKVVMHDCWLYLLAAGLGQVIFDAVPHARYRLHGGNDTGYQVGHLQRALGALRRLFRLDRAQWTRQARALGQAVGPSLPAQDEAVLKAFLDQHNLAIRWSYLRHYGLVYQRRRRPFVASLLFLAGAYRDDQP